MTYGKVACLKMKYKKRWKECMKVKRNRIMVSWRKEEMNMEKRRRKKVKGKEKRMTE